MIAVISEVWPHADRSGDYDVLANELRPLLERIDGFISAERFESCSEAGKFLSLSLWRDEAALAEWRNLEKHREIMAKGRGGICATIISARPGSCGTTPCATVPRRRQIPGRCSARYDDRT